MSMGKMFDKTIVIVGPTASGKSNLAIAIARKYGGEIISADSRQVYRGMDIGSGKVPKDHARKSKIKNQKSKFQKKYFFSEGIRHHLLDVASPKRSYNVTHFVRDAKRAIADIRKRGKVPIVCGGTGFWAQALIEDAPFPAVKPDMKLRAKLGKKSAAELFMMLGKKDPARAATIDRHNKIRLIRALEICNALGQVPSLPTNYKLPATNYTVIALNPDKETLKKNIKKRLVERMKKGMVREVKRLHEKDGVSWKRLESFGLEYRWIARYLQEKTARKEMEENLLRDITHYAKRQRTWMRRWERMSVRIHFHWTKNKKEALDIAARVGMIL